MMMNFQLDATRVPSPCFLVDEALLEHNLQLLDQVQQRTGCRIILALKGFAMWSTFPLIKRYLPGVTASSLNEAHLGADKFGGEIHVYAPAYREDELRAYLPLATHISFNSFSQWERLRPIVQESGSGVKCGIRINPEHSEVDVDLYNPCARGSRLGVTRANFREDLLDGITGLHVHALCESGADALQRLLNTTEDRFGPILHQMQWLNLGGGHHITRPGYDIDLLCRLIDGLRERYGVEVILEPGEAVAIRTGVLVATVLDLIHNEQDIAILDTSATAHMPDVLEMPYRAEIRGADLPGKHPHTYRLGGMTCLAGDVIGDYSFPEPLQIGQRLLLMDMSHYTMVKTTMFNGVHHPSLAVGDSRTGDIRVVRQFGYPDFRDRLS